MILDLTPREAGMIALALAQTHAADHVELADPDTFAPMVALAARWKMREHTCAEIHAVLDKLEATTRDAVPLGIPVSKRSLN